MATDGHPIPPKTNNPRFTPMNSKTRAIRKIERCLALSKSANEHEAATALRQAKALMEKHQIEFSQLGLSDLSVKKATSTSTRKPQAWRRILLDTIANAFECSLYYLEGCPVFVGERPAPTIALYALETLERQINIGRRAFLAHVDEQAAKDNKTLPRGVKTKIGKGYSEGWAFGCYSVVKEFAKPLSDDTKQKHDTKAQSFLNAELTESTSRPKMALHDELGGIAAQAGFVAGKQAKIHHAAGYDSNNQQANLEHNS